MSFNNKNILLIVAHPDDEWFLAEKLTEAKSVNIFVLSTPRNNFQKRKSETIKFLNRRKFNHISVEFLGDRKEILDGKCLNYVDQLSFEIRNIIKIKMPDMIVFHDYENGHPDHDATFLATLTSAYGSGIELYSFCSYRRSTIGLPTFFKPLNSNSDFFTLKFSLNELIKMFFNSFFYKEEFATMFGLGTVGVFFILCRGGIRLRNANKNKNIISIPNEKSWSFTRYKASKQDYITALKIINFN